MESMSRISAALVWLVALLVLSYAKRRAFRSVKAPAETVDTYSEVVPNITILKQGDGPYPKALEVVISTDECLYTLLLERNGGLLPPRFTSLSFDENGNTVITKGFQNCFYQGKVKERAEWQAVISLCHGVQGTFGIHGDAAQRHSLYHIEPLDRSTSKLSQLHAVYLDTEFKANNNGTCGSHAKIHDDHVRIINNIISEEELARLRERRQSGQQFLFVELVMVNDRSQYLFYESNLEATVLRSMAIANHMDRLFHVLNVRIALVEVITWTSSDQISIVSSPEGLLNNFRGYVGRITAQHDTAMLLTHIDLDGSTIGIAFTGTMCSSTSSVGVTQDQGRSEQSTGASASHSLGHILNMAHDDSASCGCPDGQSRCIMAAIITFNPPTRWSQCSIDDLNTGFTGPRNLDRCLFNEPTTVVGDLSCGNGIQDEGEDCDCGSPQECQNPCCNANTCRLAMNAQCSTGTCCNFTTCQLQPYGMSCRGRSGSCDIAEYCSGEAQDCPMDTYLRDGSTCNNGSDYCFEGTCQTRDSQCQFHFRSNNGDSRCYTYYNTRGDVFGNCGYTQTAFIPCDASDVQCGMLFCQSNGQYQRTASISVSIVTVGVSGTTCLGFTPNPGADIMNPGLVADGTRCGDGRACYSQECISVNNLPTVQNISSCPIRNGKMCSDNGQCNNLGGCSCNVRFTGRDCSVCKPGYRLNSDGRSCDDINECFNNNGGCDHNCINSEGTFDCSCHNGFRLGPDDRACIDIDECQSGISGCQQICTNTDGSFFCSCRSGYTLDSNHRTCTDINECAVNNGNCQHTCHNTGGSFSCSCRSGYRLDSNGRSCTDINECAEDGDNCEQLCGNNAGSFTCSCRLGYLLSSDGRSCIDIDECNTNRDNCQQTCTNIRGSFTCGCGSGYRLNSDGRTCRDIDECAENGDNCEQLCNNRAGDFTCSCRSGYQLDSDGCSCTDIDECQSGTSGCQQICTNTDGGFFCSCRSGYTLDSNHRTCTDINECAVNNGNCQHTCHNTGGSFSCSCRSGYRLDSNGRLCTDINECAEDSDNCEQLCRNNAGTFTCSCRSGYLLASDGRSCIDIDECDTNRDNCQQTCTNTRGSFTCECGSGYGLNSDGRTCQDIDECAENHDNCEQLCNNRAGDFTCSCRSGYQLDSDGRSCTVVIEFERAVYTVMEDVGSVEVCSTVRREGPSAELQVTFFTEDGTARAGRDYTHTEMDTVISGRLCIDIPIINNYLPGSDVQFLLRAASTSHNISTIPSTVSILDDEIPRGCTYEVVNASAAEEKIREEVVVEIANVLESIGIPNITAALATPLPDLLGNGTTTGNDTTAEPPLRIVYKAISKEYDLPVTDEGYNNFTTAVNQITEAKIVACEGDGGVSEGDIPRLWTEYRALKEDVEGNIEEIRDIFGKMLCLNERSHTEEKRKKRYFHCPERTDCTCPESREVECVCEFFACLDSDYDLPAIFGLDVIEGKPCLAFTVDTTGSMGEEIDAVKAVVRNFLASEEDGPGCYVLQPFNDYANGIFDPTSIHNAAVATTVSYNNGLEELQAFLNAIDALYPHDGGDRPERQLRALLATLMVERDEGNGPFSVMIPGSEIVLLTDASSHDPELEDDVITKAKAQNVCISFYLSELSPGDSAQYERIAAATGGKVVNSINRTSFLRFSEDHNHGQCAWFYNLTTSNQKKRAVSTSSYDTEQHCHYFTTSLLTDTLTVQGYTTQAAMIVMKPNGEEVNIITNFRGDKMYRDNSPLSGQWSVCVATGTLTISVQITDSISAILQYLTSTSTSPEVSLHYSPPPTCSEGTLALETPQIEDIGSVSIQLLDEDSGELLTESPLYRCANRLLGSVLFPQDTVMFRAIGNDVNGRSFSASLSKTATFVQSKFEVVMEGDDPIEVDQDQTLSINLTVHNRDINDTHYNFTTEPVTGFRVAFRPASLTVPAGGSGYVSMIILQHGAEAGSSYTFTVTVTGGCTSHSKNVSVQIPATTPPPISDLDECGCLNGGTCIVDVIKGRSPQCICPDRFDGVHCENETPP